MIIKETECRSILTKSNLPVTDYCINPYTGCAHACVYCYARFMKRFTNHEERWGEFVDVKANAPEIIEKQLKSKSIDKEGSIFIGSVTDAYQPAEQKYKITREILSRLIPHNFDISILTKSSLIIRDIDIIKKLRNCEIGFSINTIDDELIKKTEKRASPILKRINALNTLKNEGIKTFVFISPILPGFTDTDAIIDAVEGKADYVMAECLNCSCGNMAQIESALRSYNPEKAKKFKQAINSDTTWEYEEYKLREKCKKEGVRLAGFFYH